jgi:hypothetical protein
VPLGNELSAKTVCGPGGSRNLYGQSGTQGVHGALNPGGAQTKTRDTLAEFGPESK